MSNPFSLDGYASSNVNAQRPDSTTVARPLNPQLLLPNASSLASKGSGMVTMEAALMWMATYVK